MKSLKATIVAILAILALSVHSAEPDANLQELSRLLQKGSTPGVTLKQEQRERLETRLMAVLPPEDFIGSDKEWKVVYHDMDEGDFFQVDLKEKGDNSFDRFIWLHILYKNEAPTHYGSEDFGNYRGMGMTDVHYFILVGNVEIRAIADSQPYKNDRKIKDLLKAFKLEKIATL